MLQKSLEAYYVEVIFLEYLQGHPKLKSCLIYWHTVMKRLLESPSKDLKL